MWAEIKQRFKFMKKRQNIAQDMSFNQKKSKRINPLADRERMWEKTKQLKFRANVEEV